MVRSMQSLNAAGLAVPGWPVEWGGQDWSPLRRHIWSVEMQLACVPPPLAFNAGMIGPVIAAFGSQEMKERFLPATANLDIWWSQGFSEPDAGSDLASLRTTAVRDGEEYVVNGQKTWTTLGQYGDWIFTLVRTDPEVKKQAGISMLLIDMTSPGVTVRPIELIDGGHEVNEVFFEDVRVPAENLVGEENKGWDYAKFLLGNERVGVAPVGSSSDWWRRPRSRPRPRVRAVRPCSTTPTSPPASRRWRTTSWPWSSPRCASWPTRPRASHIRRPRCSSSAARSCSRRSRPCSSTSAVRSRWPPAPTTASAVPDWARVVGPKYLNLRKATIYGGSNEVQRQIIAGTILGLR